MQPNPTRLRHAGLFALALGSSRTLGADQNLLPDPAPGPAVRLTVVAQGLDMPIAGTEQFFPTDLDPFPDGSGRLLVITLGGVLRVIHPDTGLDPTPYLDLTNPNTQITTAFGMISVAFHPDFAIPGEPGYGRFYTIETERADAATPDFDDSLQQVASGGTHHDVIVEYRASDPGAGVFAGERREILRIEQPGRGHNVSDLAFGIGPERALLSITSGDGSNAQEVVALIRDNPPYLATVHGKILRIDPLGTDGANGRYGIPADNPYRAVPGAHPEIYSIGHRSPYRLTVDRATGAFWLAEVGQAQIEEVNRIEPGRNYGWPTKEGSFLFDQTDHDNNQSDPDLDANGTGDAADALALTDPILEIDHPTALSITGGFVYRGTRIPALVGRYVFADAVLPGLYSGDIASGPASGAPGDVTTHPADPGGASLPPGVISIGQDAHAELYLLTIDGRVLRIDPAPCSPFDLAEPLGSLNFFDIAAFVALFTAQDPASDLADPQGVFNFFDLAAYVAGFGAGCP